MAEFRERLWQLHELNGFDGECTIRAGERDFTVSKLLLACNSSVFEESLKEGLDFLEIDNFSAGVVDQIVQFCYRGKVENIGLCPEELFLAAKAYKITPLQNLASDTLGSSINQHNLLGRLVLAFEHDNEYLKKKIWAQLTVLSSRLFVNLLKSAEFHDLYETKSSVYQNIIGEGLPSLHFNLMNDPREDIDIQFRHRLQQATDAGFIGSYIIIAGEQQFKVAKNVLAAQSEYFKGLFSSSCTETATSVTFDDISAELMNHLIDFMHCESLQIEDQDIILDLFILADRFLIGNLKKFCAKQLATTISTETFVDRVRLVFEYNYPYLLEEICKKLRCSPQKNIASKALGTEEWHIFFMEQTENAQYVLDKIFELTAFNF